jgi:hypothetical protein
LSSASGFANVQWGKFFRVHVSNFTKMVNNCPSYGTFSKIQDGRRRHLGLGIQLLVSSFSGGT